MVKSPTCPVLLLILCVSLSSCVSPPSTQSVRLPYGPAARPLAAELSAPQVPSQAAPATAAPAPAASTAVPVAGTPLLAEMDGLLEKARSAADSNHLAEAIRALVTVIALYEENPGPEAKSRAEAAAAEIQKIGVRLTIEPSGEWLDDKGAQIPGASREAAGGRLQPAVYLLENYGTVKSPVPDVPIAFEFLKNSGTILGLVTTDAYGMANTTITRVEEPGREILVRAYPVVKARNKVFPFRSVFRDFAYLPPANAARVLVLETTQFGSSDNPRTADSIIATLKPSGLQLSVFNGKLAPEAFRLAIGGDREALAELGTSGEIPYAILVSVEAAEARQMELNGKKFNIYTSAAKATFRLVRADGSAVHALPIEGITGQGGTKELAADDGIRRAREALVAELQKSMKTIVAALAKD
jgi:hypothetical protein